MHDIEDIIEKYRLELIEFSKQNMCACCGYIPPTEQPTQKERKTEDAPSENTEPEKKETQFESTVAEEAVIRPYKNYEDFENRNRSRGTLRVQVFAADRSFPVAGARVTVEVPFLIDSRELFSGNTDADGIVDGIILPAPNRELSLEEELAAEPYALYTVRVTHPDYVTGEYEKVQIFDSVKSIQPVELVPRVRDGNEPGEVVYGGVG